MTDFIICYDIANPRRLGRIHRALKKRALPIQYSVFLFEGSPQQLDACLSALRDIMDEREDDIRAYPIPKRGIRLTIGATTLPHGVHWSALLDPMQKEEPIIYGSEGGEDDDEDE